MHYHSCINDHQFGIFVDFERDRIELSERRTAVARTLVSDAVLATAAWPVYESRAPYELTKTPEVTARRREHELGRPFAGSNGSPFVAKQRRV